MVWLEEYGGIIKNNTFHLHDFDFAKTHIFQTNIQGLKVYSKLQDLLGKEFCVAWGVYNNKGHYVLNCNSDWFLYFPSKTNEYRFVFKNEEDFLLCKLLAD